MTIPTMMRTIEVSKFQTFDTMRPGIFLRPDFSKGSKNVKETLRERQPRIFRSFGSAGL